MMDGNNERLNEAPYSVELNSSSSGIQSLKPHHWGAPFFFSDTGLYMHIYTYTDPKKALFFQTKSIDTFLISL